MACAGGHFGACECLLGAGTDVNKKDTVSTPLDNVPLVSCYYDVNILSPPVAREHCSSHTVSCNE